MIRLHFDPHLPMLGLIGQQDDNIAVIFNSNLIATFSQTERADVFNELMAAIEQRGTLIDLTERRELRKISQILDLIHIPAEKAFHGMDPTLTQR